MKLLVLSCDTGEGHNSAARAITEELERRGLDYTQADPLSFGRKKTAGIVAASYNGIIKKAPAAFGMIYRVGDLYSSADLAHLFCQFALCRAPGALYHGKRL